MSLNHVPRDKNGVPLEHDQIVYFDDRETQSVICGTILQPGTERSTIRYAEGKIKQINNNLIEVKAEPQELV
ncbi:MAG: hypothetical protein A2V69_02330 [Candidatus Portnoybacteria bacterium RBG_13_40_8]|uniref:Uncharacterized protein n=1 Tax=Candidatus Portnoybacteria bacterium RBG_13_40_8 TaxID=1801990 RepID=A0A1G2F365_9BACT|nr:MAG: hypothetical protein A2V69_02330 [Candidatus Portnoybacteria bacterium RBG_13_40_8]OGZ35796.1 MAG: hypothetical protein A2V60_02935 [Candidatus Portnoybacteria bacterium RIFCSPHIGHO2_01_FULL_39_19]